jgi:roadblock/LC7 domain-containing protein
MTGGSGGKMMMASGSGGMGASPMAGGTGGTPAGTGGMTAMMGTGGSTSGPPGEICTRWKADRMDLSEGTWTGSAASCDEGDLTGAGRDNAYRLHSLYRFMAGLDPVEMTDANNKLAQGCALLMTANGMLSHMPDSSWKCYTAENSKTAGSSSLSGGGSVSSVDGYMMDPGNPTTLGHRRWILSSMLAGVGFGSSGQFSCQYQPPSRPAAGGKAWTAWPPDGQIPIQAMSGGFMSVDQTGWSLQSDSIDFASAQVKVTVDGMDQAVTTTQLGGGYGSLFAMRFNPMGWTTAAGKTYHVAVSGTSMPIEYDVEVVDCK